MIRKPGSWSPTLVVLLALALLLAACGGGDAATTTTEGEAATTTTASDGGESTTTTAVAEQPYENPAEGVFADRVDYGLIADLTGPTASTQTAFHHGTLAVFDRVNRDGGVNGREINAIVEDEKYDAAVGVAAYNKLVSETPVVGITGANNSNLQSAIIEDVDTNGVPIIGAESTVKIAVNPFREYFFAMECTYADQADISVAYAFSQTDNPTPSIVTFVLNVASGQEYADLVKARVEQSGGTISGQFVMEPGAQEGDAQSQDIAALAPDAIILHGGTSSAIPTLNSFFKFGIVDTPTIGIFAQKLPAVALAQPDITDNWAAVHCYAAGNEGVEIADQMEADIAASGYPAEYIGNSDFANGYAVGLVIVEAMTRAGNELNRETLKDAVRSLEDFSTGGLSPNVTFGPDDPVGVEGVVPFTFDVANNIYVPTASFDDWAGCIQNEYLTESIADYDVSCAP